jgi:hypothetical protein
MKLFRFHYVWDFGHEWYASFICRGGWSVLYVNVNLDDYFVWDASAYLAANKGCPLQFKLSICSFTLYLKLFAESYY